MAIENGTVYEVRFRVAKQVTYTQELHEDMSLSYETEENAVHVYTLLKGILNGEPNTWFQDFMRKESIFPCKLVAVTGVYRTTVKKIY